MFFGRVARLLLLLVALTAAAGSTGLQPAEPPRVRLIATGGTISNRTGGRLTSEELVASVPRLTEVAVADGVGPRLDRDLDDPRATRPGASRPTPASPRPRLARRPRAA